MKKYYWLTCIVALITIVIDLITKFLVIKFLVNPIDIIPNFFTIVNTINRGAIFGTLQGWLPLFAMVTIVFLIMIFYSKEKLLNNKPLSLAYGLIIGGACGNMIDRLILPPFGGVIDFLDFHLKTSASLFSYPVCNFADVFIILGVIILLFNFKTKETSKKDLSNKE